MSVRYAACCKGCGNVELYAFEHRPGAPDRGKRSTVPLTPQGHVPVLCPQCGAQGLWRVPATAEDIEKWEQKQIGDARVAELCKTLDIDGLLKVPEEVRAAAEVKNALSNLLSPLEGEVLKAAQANIIRIARSGVAVEAHKWVEMYDRAVQKAISETRKAKVTA